MGGHLIFHLAVIQYFIYASPMEISGEPQTIAVMDSTKQPRGLYVLFGTEMWERLSFYGMRAILVLYMVAPLASGGLGFGTKISAQIYGLYTGSVYITPILGGWLADRWLGCRRAVLVGGIIIAMGHFSMAFHGISFFYAGLILIVLGTGLLKSNISAMVGCLYRENDPRRDAGFSIFYMGINVGALLAPFVCGTLAQAPFVKTFLIQHGYNPNDSWHWGFAAAGVGMVLGLIQYIAQGKRLGNVGNPPRHRQLKHQAATKHVPLTGEEIKRILAVGALFLFSSIFWMAFEQAGSSMNLFADKLTRNELFGLSFPSSWFQSVNSIFIVILAPIFAAFWPSLGKRDPSSPAKFAYGLLFAGLGFLVLTYASTLTSLGPVGPSWLILVYFLHTIGELCLSPVGLSMVTKLSPARLVGSMMGFWFLSIALGNYMAGWLAGFFDATSQHLLVTLFGSLAAITIGAAVLLALILPFIRKLMCGVK